MRTLRLGMTGTDVMEIQSLLRKMGYLAAKVDRIFGPEMKQAVTLFQRNFGLSPDGVIGAETYRILNRFLMGYDIYTIRPGDIIYNIAKKYQTDWQSVVTANPNMDPNRLAIGQNIVVPYNFKVVDTDIDYTYDVLERDILGLKAKYPFVQTGIAGKSVLGRNLYFIRLGTGSNEYHYNGAHHALEWITAPILMKFVEDFLYAYTKGTDLGGYNIRTLWSLSSIFVIPMVNPDGVDLVLNGLQPDNPFYYDLIQWNSGSMDFSGVWQANNRGVDLNHNYDAAWQQSKEAEISYGITGPGPTRYSGPGPESEPESRTIADFTRNHNFRLVFAYHSQGEVIYWNFMNMATLSARQIGETLAKISGYKLDETTGIASFAGYKDWFIQQYRRPGYTIEVGRGKNPLPIEQFDSIYRDNIGMLLYAATI